MKTKSDSAILTIAFVLFTIIFSSVAASIKLGLDYTVRFSEDSFSLFLVFAICSLAASVLSYNLNK